MSENQDNVAFRRAAHMAMQNPFFLGWHVTNFMRLNSVTSLEAMRQAFHILDERSFLLLCLCRAPVLNGELSEHDCLTISMSYNVSVNYLIELMRESLRNLPEIN